LRPLSPEEQALWRRVVESVRPLHGAFSRAEPAPAEPVSIARPAAAKPAPTPARKVEPGTTLDGSWDKRLSRGLVQPDRILDLHGHSLATAYDLLDHRLEQSVTTGDRVLLLITGKPRSGADPRGGRRLARRLAPRGLDRRRPQRPPPPRRIGRALHRAQEAPRAALITRA
jgi:DNA-nicking Smr family endonuclease